MRAANERKHWTRATIRALLRSLQHPSRLSEELLAQSALARQHALSSGADASQALRKLITEAWHAWEQDSSHPSAQRAREVLRRHFWEGRSLKEIGAQLNLHDSSVRRALYEGLDTLAAILQRWEEKLQQEHATTATSLPLCWHSPPPPSLLVGRESLIARIEAMVSNGIKGIALHGLGGIGKTTLLAHLIYSPHMRAHFPDGVLWASLGDIPDRFGILGEWGSALGMSQTTLKSLDSYTARASALRARLLERRIAIVLDDVRRREDAEALQVGGVNTLYLYSTYSAELAHELVSGEAALGLSPLTQAESLALFQALAPELSASQPALAIRIAQLCDGFPLVIAWAAHAFSVAARAHQIGRIARLIQTLQRQAAPAEAIATLSEALGNHLEMLSPAQRRILFALINLPVVRGMPRRQVLDLCSVPALTRDPEGVLISLVENGLLLVERDRFRMHAIVHQALRQLGDGNTEAFAASEAMQKQLFSSLARRSSPPKIASPEDIEVARLGFEAGVRLGKLRTVARLLVDWWETLVRHGQSKWLETLCCQLESQLSEQLSDWRYALQAKRSTLLAHSGLGTEARALALEAQEQLRRAAPKPRLAALTACAHTLNYTGDLHTARKTLRAALALAKSARDDKKQLELLLLLAAVEHNRGHYREARRALRQANQIARQQRDRVALARCLYSLAVVSRHQRRYHEALHVGQSALKSYRALGDVDSMIRCLTMLGVVNVELGDYEAAARHYSQASAMLSEFTDFRARLMLQYAQGVLLMRKGNLEDAANLLGGAFALAQWHGLPWFSSSIAFELGECQMALHNIPHAAQLFEHGLSQSEAQGYEDLAALHRYGLSRVADAQGDTLRALDLAQASLVQLERSDHFRLPEVRKWFAELIQRSAPVSSSPTGELSPNGKHS